MADLETSIAFGYGSLELEDAALPSVTRVVEMLRRHTALTLSIEAHCGLEAGEQYAEHFTRRRALAVRRAMERSRPASDRSAHHGAAAGRPTRQRHQPDAAQGRAAAPRGHLHRRRRLGGRAGGAASGYWPFFAALSLG